MTGPPQPAEVLWLEHVLATEPDRPCPPLSGRRHVDVCIVGGGYTGLWTALNLVREAPDLKVLVVEAWECGFGASGRNGGWAVGWYDKLDELIDQFGPADGLWLAERSRQAVIELEDRCGELGIDCHYRRSGALYAASAPGQRGAWQPSVEACLHSGRANRFRTLAPGEAASRTGIGLLDGGAEQPDAATVHPGLLVRGLRRAALDQGIEIAEATEVLGVERTSPVRLTTRDGEIVAEKAVIATGAWAARLRELRRAVLPFASHMVATPAVPKRLASLGWTDGVAVSDFAELVHYAQVTRDGRIAFGRGGGAIGFAGTVTPRHLSHPRWTRIVARDFHRWFPELSDLPFTHRWGGAVDYTPGHFPFVGALGEHGNVVYAGGYSGDGVAQSTVLASIVAAKVLEVESQDSQCPLGGGPRHFLPPEPLRSLGGRALREAVLAAEARDARGGSVSAVNACLRRLARFRTPTRIEPRLRKRRRAPDRGNARERSP